MLKTNHISDDELIMLIHEKSEDAKDILYQRHQNIVEILLAKYNFMVYKLNIDKEEIKSEAFIGFTDAINSYIPNKDATFKTFLTLCVRRRILKNLRKFNTEKSKFHSSLYSLDYSYDELNTPLIEGIQDNELSDPLNKMEDEERVDYITSKIKEVLSEFEFSVYEHLLEGLDYNEISKVLDKNPKQVDNAIQRIKIKVKEIINDEKLQTT